MPGAEGADLLDAAAELTAKTLIERAVFVEPHDGHFTFVSASVLLIVRCNCSNFSLHALQVYS